MDDQHHVVITRCRKFDIMDSMLQKLEKYADNLESIVEHRTAELMDEKQKTDMLLYRMLPPYALLFITINLKLKYIKHCFCSISHIT